jgi:predicted peptidase
MSRLRLVGALLAAGLAATATSPAAWAETPARGRDGESIRSVTAITDVYAFGQKVAAVAIEYAEAVNPRTLDLDTFTVADTIYNFRFNPVSDLPTLENRTIIRVYTNDEPAIEPDGVSSLGRYVIVELDPSDPGGNTVIVSKCPTFLCSVKVNPDLLTQVVQNEDIYAQPGKGIGWGQLIARSTTTPHPLTASTINLHADEFVHDTFAQGTSTLPYAYYVPDDYDPSRAYPVVVILPGHGMGFDGDNEGVQVAADIPATAWLRPEWTGTTEDVIVLAPQNPRVGVASEAAIMVALLESFMQTYSIDPDRVYASTVSYGSTTAWQAMATTRPGLFSAALITGGFAVSAAQAASIASDRTPIWITHGTNDHLLNVATTGRLSRDRLRAAYVAAGVDPAAVNDLVRYTEYGNAAFSQPDFHLAAAPTYEDETILEWLLAQEH